MRLLASLTLLLGVRIAVQVIPPSALARPLRLPLATLRSARVRPLTASLKVMVTVAVSPIFKAVSLMLIVAVGAMVSWIATCTTAAADVPPSPSLRVMLRVRLAWPMALPALLFS